MKGYTLHNWGKKLQDSHILKKKDADILTKKLYQWRKAIPTQRGLSPFIRGLGKNIYQTGSLKDAIP